MKNFIGSRDYINPLELSKTYVYLSRMDEEAAILL